MNRKFKVPALSVAVLLLLSFPAFAGPPFLTDDPEPVDYQHWETYLFGIGDHSHGNYSISGPAVEVNYGALPDTQLHLIVPMTTVGGPGLKTMSGLGDTEFGIKYRFIHETNGWPQVGIFPFAELPTGDANRGLGNGQTWFKLPVWAQKSWEPWTTYGGGGMALNPAPGQRNYAFGGWQVQRDLTEHLALGAEFYGQGRDNAFDHGYGALNAGGTYKITEHFSLLFTGGHSIIGDNHTLWYFGLYFTW